MADDKQADESSSEQSEQREIYDFIYKDSDRISSYYAQIFTGKLTSIETVGTKKSGTDYTGKLTVGVVGVDGKATNETQDSQKQVYDPHDMVTTDVLSHITDGKFVNRDPVSAKNGEIVLTSGTILFADTSMVELGMTAFSSAMVKQPNNKAAMEGVKMLRTFLDKSVPPSAFVLVCDDNVVIAGTLRDEGMQEPISTYYYKHGGRGLDNVYVVGIKEVQSRTGDITQTFGAMVEASRSVADALQGMILPEEGIRVTPIAIFRRIGPPDAP